MTIQSVYNKYQQKGFVGDLARPIAPYAFDTGIAGVELRPGEGVYYDSTTNKFIKPVDAATRLLVTHIVGTDKGTLQTTISTPAGANSNQEVVIAADTVGKFLLLGAMYVVAGETLEFGDALVFDEAAGDWIKATAVTSDATTLPRASIICIDVQGAADGEIVEVRNNGQIR